MVLGDSNACRAGKRVEPWPNLLERQSRGALRVFNESRNGRTTRFDADLLNGLHVAEHKTYPRPLHRILIALGTNDLKAKYGPPDTGKIIDGLDAVVRTVHLKSPGTGIVILTPPPLGPVVDGELAGAQGRIAPLIKAYRRYAQDRRILLIDLHALLSVEAHLDEDHVHLNGRGIRKVAEVVWEYFKGVMTT